MKKYFKDRTFWLVIINLGLAIYFLLSEFFVGWINHDKYNRLNNQDK